MNDIAEEAIKALYDTDTRPGPNAGKSIRQSDAEPVAWQFRTILSRRILSGGNWTLWLSPGKPDLDPNFYEIRPLYARSAHD